MRLPARLTLPLTAAVATVLAAPASAGPAPGLCEMDTRRGEIPKAFAVDACVDGSKLILRNNLTIALTVQRAGDVGNPHTDKTDVGAAAIATRTVAGDEVIFLPGDKMTFPVGPGKATVQVAGSKHGGFYALATALGTFLPGRSAGAVGAFTDMIKELNDVFEKYRNCLAGKNWIGQLGCRALFVRDVEFAIGRAAVKGLAKEALSVVLSGVTFTTWADAQVPDTRKRLNSEAIRLKADPNAPQPPLSGASTCKDWYAASFERRKAYAGTVEPGVEMAEPPPKEPNLHEAYMYGFIFGGCDRAKKRGLSPADVPLSNVVAGDYVNRG
jgi:hypothetical protein